MTCVLILHIINTWCSAATMILNSKFSFRSLKCCSIFTLVNSFLHYSQCHSAETGQLPKVSCFSFLPASTPLCFSSQRSLIRQAKTLNIEADVHCLHFYVGFLINMILNVAEIWWIWKEALALLFSGANSENCLTVIPYVWDPFSNSFLLVNT